MRKNTGRIILGIVVILLVYLFTWPVLIHPVSWTAPETKGYTSEFAANDRLAGLQLIPIAPDHGPERMLVRDGWIYFASAAGAIVRIKPDGTERQVMARTGGRPIGFDFDSNGDLIIADPMVGEQGAILRATHLGEQSKIEVLLTMADHPATSDPLRFVDGVAVAKTGKIYFTDATQKYGAKKFGGNFEASSLDILEHQPTGRVLEYDPATKKVRVVMKDLGFANGMTLSADEKSLFVCETAEYRIWKVSVDANDLSAKEMARLKEGPAVVIAENMPGFPDNVSRGLDGRIWVGLVKPRADFLDQNADKPWMRSLAFRLPRFMWPVPPAYGHVVAMDENGKVLISLQDPKGAYPETTGVTEDQDRIYIQSLKTSSIGWLEKKTLGL